MMVKELINNKVVERDMTPEEIAELQSLADNQPTPEPTAEERLEAIESALLELMGVDVDG